MGKKIDLTGQRFGRLVVLGDSGKINKSRAVKWKCLCDCGKETEVIGASLKNGSVKSCGCSRIKDIKGNRYGMLTAVKLDRTFKGQAYWEFLCDCGKTKVIGKNSVESEHVFSCGCLQRKIASFSGKKNSKILTDYTVNKDLKEKTRLSALMQKEGKKNTSTLVKKRKINISNRYLISTARNRNKGGLNVFYIVSKDLPTIATCTSMSRAYAFRNMLLRLGYQASVTQPEKI